MSALTSALIGTLVVGLVSTTKLVSPPPLPPEPEPAPAPEHSEAPAPDVPPAPVRDALPPGLQPVRFPLEQQRDATSPPSGEHSSEAAPPPARRSIVDLRDPFNRPPPRPRPEGERHRSKRLLMPDLKDPFAEGTRHVRSKTLTRHVPNDIRDPFRSRPQTDGRPRCAKTTDDGTVVQAPGERRAQSGDCQPSAIDLRDPFVREP